VGYVVRVEEPVNGFTDLVAQKGPVQIAIEIETGKSNWRANLVKNVKKGFARVLIITTNESAHREISAEIEQETEMKIVEVIQAQEFVESQNLEQYNGSSL
jgi:KaiC/GvpD/RAD55 family RecA-like ATPase